MEDNSSELRETPTLWKPAQTYTMAVICLVIGLAIGYLVRGSASPAAGAVASANAQAQQAQDAHASMGQQAMPSLADMKRMADKQAAPLLTKLKADPKDVDTLNKTAVTYKAAHQFDEAIVYFKKALAIDPSNVPIRTDMASCMYYTGDVDGAIAELQKALTYDPKHPGALMNLGIIKWQGKNDAKGAIVEWQTLLKLNPNFPQKAAVEHLIDEAKQTQSVATAAPPKE
jgi:Flp pilus assembly protein TadD